MLVSRCAVQFSLGTFFKHLPVSNPATLCPYRFRPKTLTAPAIRSSSYFETLDSRQKEQVHLYVDTLLQWNQKMNLPAVKEADEVMERHIEDSLAIIPPVRNSRFDLSHCLPRLGSDTDGVYEQEMHFLGTRCRSHWFVECSSCKRKSRGQNLGQALRFRENFDVACCL